MGLINYLGESKVIKKICELLNVKDVKLNGTSVVDANGDANIADVILNKKLTNEDLDDIKTPGFYVGQYGNSCANKPTDITGQFGLIVIKTASSSDQTRQIIYSPSDANLLQEERAWFAATNTWGAWTKVKITDEYVKQIATGSAATQYRILSTTTNTDTEETNTARKCSGLTYQPSNGALRLARQHTSTDAVSEYMAIGNDIPKGTAGNVYGALRLFSQNTYQTTLWDRFGAITANRNYELPNGSGALALRDNITRAKLDSAWNLLSTPYYASAGTSSGITYETNGDGSLTFTGTASAAVGVAIRRYSEAWTLPPGKYKFSATPNGGSTSSYCARIGTSEGTSTITWLGNDTGGGVEFTLTQEKIIHIQLQIANAYAIQGSITFEPLLIQLNGGWVDLGALTEDTQSTIALGDFSEFLIRVSLNTGGTPKKLTFNILPFDLLLTDTEYYSTIFENTGNYFNFWVIAKLSGDNVLFTPKKNVTVSVPLPQLTVAWELFGKR